MPKITTDMIISKAKEYKFEIAFLFAILIFAALAKTFANFFLDYRVVIIIIGILWYLGYLTNIQKKFKEKINKINYFRDIK